MFSHRLLASLACTSLLISAAVAATQSFEKNGPLDVHEWGTFTSVQDEYGNALGNINTDDEPVPNFVHNSYSQIVSSASQLPDSLIFSGKGIIPQKVIPSITMRLETPVLYFHPAQKTSAAPLILDVDVAFHGGWLTQFYPDATATMPGFRSASINPTTATTGTLRWHNLLVNDTTSKIPAVATQDPVWTSPRNVVAASVLAPPVSRDNLAHEREQFLFYRGVGHLDSPVRVLHENNALTFHNNTAAPLQVPAAWLADIRPDNTLAFRDLGPIPFTADPTSIAARTPADFDALQYSPGNLAQLRTALRNSLEDQGLNADEADALLNTWQNSYFKSPGLRLLYIVPQSWTDQTLPLSITSPTSSKITIHRAMIGRIEIITPQQRALLAQIAAGPTSDTAWITAAIKDLSTKDPDVINQLRAGKIPLSTTMPVPPDYDAYLALGRFRQALLLDEDAHHPSPALSQFIKAYNLAAFHNAD